jgi:hypothetical protein
MFKITPFVLGVVASFGIFGCAGASGDETEGDNASVSSQQDEALTTPGTVQRTASPYRSWCGYSMSLGRHVACPQTASHPAGYTAQ